MLSPEDIIEFESPTVSDLGSVIDSIPPSHCVGPESIPIFDEQKKIIQAVEGGNNVVVDTVAGNEKPASISGVKYNLFEKEVLTSLYNESLTDKSKEKLNPAVRTIHTATEYERDDPPSYQETFGLPDWTLRRDYFYRPLEGETFEDKDESIWKFRIFRRYRGISRIMAVRDKPYPDCLLSDSDSYQVKYRDGYVEEIELTAQDLLERYQDEPFQHILTPQNQVRHDCFLVFDTEWVPVPNGCDLWNRVENLIQLSWIIYEANREEIVVRDYKGKSHKDFHLAMMQLACDMAEYTPIVMGHNVIDWKEKSGFDIPALKRFFPEHPALYRNNIYGNPIYDTMHSNGSQSLNDLLLKWTGRSKVQPNDSLQDCRDTFEIFWRTLTESRVVKLPSANLQQRPRPGQCHALISKPGYTRLCIKKAKMGIFCTDHIFTENFVPSYIEQQNETPQFITDEGVNNPQPKPIFILHKSVSEYITATSMTQINN